MPRIIAGSARGTKLAVPDGLCARPTGDRVKEALFSILQPRLPADGFLDLFAGSGQIGLEAASRGSSRVVLVEREQACLRALRQNVTRTHLTDQVTVLPQDVSLAVQQLRRKSVRFELIFLDPPYMEASVWLQRLAPDLAGLLAPDGMLILEQPAAEATVVTVTHLQNIRNCQYGRAMLSFFKGMADPPGISMATGSLEGLF